MARNGSSGLGDRISSEEEVALPSGSSGFQQVYDSDGGPPVHDLEEVVGDNSPDTFDSVADTGENHGVASVVSTDNMRAADDDPPTDKVRAVEEPKNQYTVLLISPYSEQSVEGVVMGSPIGHLDDSKGPYVFVDVACTLDDALEHSGEQEKDDRIQYDVVLHIGPVAPIKKELEEIGAINGSTTIYMYIGGEYEAGMVYAMISQDPTNSLENPGYVLAELSDKVKQVFASKVINMLPVVMDPAEDDGERRIYLAQELSTDGHENVDGVLKILKETVVPEGFRRQIESIVKYDQPSE